MTASDVRSGQSRNLILTAIMAVAAVAAVVGLKRRVHEETDDIDAGVPA